MIHRLDQWMLWASILEYYSRLHKKLIKTNCDESSLSSRRAELAELEEFAAKILTILFGLSITSPKCEME